MTILTLAVVFLASSTAAVAQPRDPGRARGEGGAGETQAAPQVELPRPPPSPAIEPAPQITGYILLAILAGLTVGVNFLPTKRGHQD